MPRYARPLHPKSLTKLAPGKHADGMGLTLVVTEHGARRWTWRGTVQGRRVEYGLGSISAVPLAKARETAREWYLMSRSGVDPLAAQRASQGAAMRFEDVARELWRRDIQGTKSDKHAKQWITTLETYAFSRIGARPIGQVERSEVHDLLAPIWRTKAETADRVKQRVRAVFEFAIGKGYRSAANPVDAALTKSLGPRTKNTENHPAVAVEDLPEVYSRICAAKGMGARALAFTILTATRSKEVRYMTWDEIDLEARVWSRPSERMKAGRPHRVPLSDAAVELLEATPRPEGERYVFFGSRARSALSDMTLTAVLKRLEVKAEPQNGQIKIASAHGFRATFRNWVEIEGKGDPRARELCLAHVNRNKVEAAYLRDDLLELRRDMMAAWADFARSEMLAAT